MRTLVACLLLTAAACAPGAPAPGEAAPAATPAPDVLLVVLNKGAASASFVDPTNGETLASVGTGEGPHEIAVSPDGRRAVVTNYGADQPGTTLTLLDLVARTPVGTIDLAPLERPHGVAWLPDGRHVVVTIEADSLVAVVDVDSGAVVGRIPTRQASSHMLALSPDGAFAYVANVGDGSVSMLDVAGRFLVRTVRTGQGAEGIALSPDGAELWVTNRSANTVVVLDAATLAPLDTLGSADFPIRVAFAMDGELAVVTNARSGTLRLFDALERDGVATLALPIDSTRVRGTMLGPEFGRGTGVPIGVLVSPDGRRAYVANANADLVTVVDLAEPRVVGYLPTGREPDGLAWAPRQAP
jgi:YVTN family beta-propeller protein